MNIKQAKNEIENTIKAYLLKDKFGVYRVDIVRQRPLLIMGAPGIGKTAIMEQIAKKMNIGIVAYSMTHHTRQSAIGLPYIEQKVYAGKEYSVSEYTMSEIVSSIYNYMEETGLKEGILFLDEINCVSETLSPAMLQFLQYKTFGNHQIPKGWTIVTAGNPPEYNKSVREFDIVTLDRVRKIDVEPDLAVWKEYAVSKGVHNAIITFLEIKRNYFYSIESTVDGKKFVTARGWEDLSQMLLLYEELAFEIDAKFCAQYIQNEEIAKEFAIYYQLYNKYKTDYKVLDIIEGNYGEEVRARALEAKFDERITLLGLLVDTIVGFMKENLHQERLISEAFKALKGLKVLAYDKEETRELEEIFRNIISQRKAIFENKISKGLLGKEEELCFREVIVILEEYMHLSKDLSKKKGFEFVKSEFDKLSSNLEDNIEITQKKLDNMFSFVEDVFGKGQEMLIIVTELTANKISAKFIANYGAEKYFENNQDLLFYERQQDIMKEIGLLHGKMK